MAIPTRNLRFRGPNGYTVLNMAVIYRFLRNGHNSHSVIMAISAIMAIMAIFYMRIRLYFWPAGHNGYNATWHASRHAGWHASRPPMACRMLARALFRGMRGPSQVSCCFTIWRGLKVVLKPARTCLPGMSGPDPFSCCFTIWEVSKVVQNLSGMPFRHA